MRFFLNNKCDICHNKLYKMQKLKLKKLYFAMFLTITGNSIAAELQNFDTDQQLRQQQLVADQQIRQQQRDQALEKQIQPVGFVA